MVLELIQNAWDEKGVSKVEIRLSRDERSRFVRVEVEDDSPHGFQRLSDAYTLFAKSTKVENPELRGMFNIGEKLVIACCEGGAVVSTTTGTIEFDVRRNERKHRRAKRERGSLFVGFMRMTQSEQLEVENGLQTLIPPKGIETRVNGELVEPREPLAVLKVKALPAIAWSEERGGLAETRRNTTLEVYEVRDGDEATLYCLGLPMVALPDDKYHVNVGHRIPCDLERESVRASLLRQIRTSVLNHFHAELSEDDTGETWVQEAVADDDATPEAIESFLDARFGKKRASHDPNDPEATKRFQSEDGRIVFGAELKEAVWEKAREHGLIKPATTYTPSLRIETSPDGKDVSYPEAKWTAGMKRIVAYAARISEVLLGHAVSVGIVNHNVGRQAACYWRDIPHLDFNIGRLGKAWFEQDPREVAVNELLIHELAHDETGDHLSAVYHEECCRLGALLAKLALETPGLFEVK